MIGLPLGFFAGGGLSDSVRKMVNTSESRQCPSKNERLCDRKLTRCSQGLDRMVVGPTPAAGKEVGT